MNLKLYIFWAICISFYSSCHLDKWDLEDKSNITIPNFSKTIEDIECHETFQSNIYPVSNNVFVTAVLKPSNFISIIKITQKLIKDEWVIDHEELLNLEADKLNGFVKSGPNYYLLISRVGVQKIIQLNNDFTVVKENESFKSFIDTFYNEIKSISFNTIYADSSSAIFLTGQLHSFSKNYSCVMKLNFDLEPIFIRTYFENDTIGSIVNLNKDQFILINQNKDELSLIVDNEDRSLYKKYDLSIGETLRGATLLSVASKLYVAGYSASGNGKIIDIMLNNRDAFVTDIKNFSVKDFKVHSSSRNTILLCGVSNIINQNTGFLSEYKDRSYLWCNTFEDHQYHKCLAINEASDVGLIYLFLIEKEGRYFLNFVRTDEEGATLNNPYDLNCLQ